MSKNCQKLNICFKKLSLAIFLKKRTIFGIFSDIQMSICPEGQVPSQRLLTEMCSSEFSSLWFHPVTSAGCVWSAESWGEMNEQVMTYCTGMPAVATKVVDQM